MVHPSFQTCSQASSSLSLWGRERAGDPFITCVQCSFHPTIGKVHALSQGSAQCWVYQLRHEQLGPHLGPLGPRLQYLCAPLLGSVCFGFWWSTLETLFRRLTLCYWNCFKEPEPGLGGHRSVKGQFPGLKLRQTQRGDHLQRPPCPSQGQAEAGSSPEITSSGFLPFPVSGLSQPLKVYPWLIHVNVWQKPLQYCKVISLQLIKKN